jgi:nicotinate-nucleotide adenylyltransferase
MKTVALYGGSFDPPHIGHEAIIKALKKLDFIDKIIIMPTFLNPFKENFTAPAPLRLQWLQKSFSDYGDLTVSSFEVDKERKVPAIESVKMLKEKYDKVYLVIGADNLKSLKDWYKYNELKDLVTFIVATRKENSVPQHFITLKIDEDISSSELREKIDISKLPKKCASEIAHYYKEHNAKQN